MRGFFGSCLSAVLNQGNRDPQSGQELADTSDFFPAFVGQAAIRVFFRGLRLSVLNKIRAHTASFCPLRYYGPRSECHTTSQEE